MKKVMFVLLLSIASGSLWAQEKSTRATLDMTPLQVDSVWVTIEGDDGDVLWLKPNANGQITFSKNLHRAIELRFGIEEPVKGNLGLYLEPGDDLLIKTDFGERTAFSGKGSENATVLHELKKLHSKNYNQLDGKKVSMDVILEQLKQMNKANMDFLEVNREKVSTGFYKYHQIKLYYDALAMDIVYPYLLYPYYQSQGLDKSFADALPTGYMDMIEKVTFSDDLLEYPAYSKFIRGTLNSFLRYRHLYELGELDRVFKQEEHEKRQMEYDLAKQYLTGKIKNEAMFSNASSLLRNAKDVRSYGTLIPQFLADGGDAEQANQLQTIYDRALKLAAGAKAPTFTLDDMDGNKVSLADFIGKVVYIDLWASWCAPCRQEMRNGSPQLHDKLKDKDVVFLYISIDDNEQHWRKAIEDDKIKGIHLLSKGGINSEIAKAFNVSGIPRYVIIGKDGNILDNDAPRPSQDKAYESLLEASKI